MGRFWPAYITLARRDEIEFISRCPPNYSDVTCSVLVMLVASYIALGKEWGIDN